MKKFWQNVASYQVTLQYLHSQLIFNLLIANYFSTGIHCCTVVETHVMDELLGSRLSISSFQLVRANAYNINDADSGPFGSRKI